MSAGDLQGGRQTGEGCQALSPECQSQVLCGKEAKVSLRIKIITRIYLLPLCLKKNPNYKSKLQDNCFFLTFAYYSQSCRYRASPVQMLFLCRLCRHPALPRSREGGSQMRLHPVGVTRTFTKPKGSHAWTIKLCLSSAWSSHWFRRLKACCRRLSSLHKSSKELLLLCVTLHPVTQKGFLLPHIHFYYWWLLYGNTVA